jgi:hypothetical protein
MGPDDFEILLRESVYFRSMLVELLHSSEQSLSIVAAAVARQVDAGRFAADLLALQQAAAVDDPDPTRDRILNAVRSHLQLHRVD